jgi:fructose-1,6-bisphosphatase/inositol monophosphatase family enzyme
MDEEIKILAQKIVKKIDRKLRSTIKSDPYMLSKTINIGADGTPTKYIDKIAEDVAIKELKKSKIPVNLLSEEAGFVDFNGSYVFVLDPVDGTRNAMRGIPFFSISLAVGKKNLSDVSYGIIKNVPTGDEFIAEKDHGSFFNKKPVVIPDFPASELLFSVSIGKYTDPITKSITNQNVIRSLGCASLEMCMVAIGALDGYIVGREFMRVTDIAASTLFVRQAGGIVADKYGNNLEMGLTLDERTSVIATGNLELIQRISKDLIK